MSLRESENSPLYAHIKDENLMRQYDLLENCVEIGLMKGIEAFDKYTLWSLNAAAVANIAQFGGRFRKHPVYVGNHVPPHFKDGPELIDEFISVIMRTGTSSTIQPSYRRMHFGDSIGFIHLLKGTVEQPGRPATI